MKPDAPVTRTKLPFSTATILLEDAILDPRLVGVGGESPALRARAISSGGGGGQSKWRWR